MVKVMVAGAGGRMGGRIIAALEGQEGIALSGAFEQKGHRTVGLDAGEVAGTGKKGLSIEGSLESIIDSGDVIIDFTDPEATLAHVEIAVAGEKAMVIGTTGMEGREKSWKRRPGRYRLFLLPIPVSGSISFSRFWPTSRRFWPRATT